MVTSDDKERRRRNLHAKRLHEERDGEYRLKIKPIEKGRKRMKPLRPVDVLNLTEDDFDDLYNDEWQPPDDTTTYWRT